MTDATPQASAIASARSVPQFVEEEKCNENARPSDSSPWAEPVKSLEQRLDEACERHDLEWLVLPCDLGSDADSQIQNFRYGPYWCALMEPGATPQR